MINLTTIRQGERVAVWDKAGQVTFVDGPRRMFLFNRTIQPLPRFSALADEYLAIRYVDGKEQHLPGPASVWFNPVEHENITVEKALPIDAHEAVVVYSRDGADVNRRVVTGPASYIPMADEWLHEFRWHGADPRNPKRKIPRALNFTKLRVIPDQMYFDVDDVRTADDALLVVKLMVFFELTDVEQMLKQTHDPIADFINALSADVIDFVGGQDFEQFKLKTEELNNLDTYTNLTRRAERIGYQINKVVYRGYEAGEKLQAMHDDAIETRTKLKLEAETERQAQELADLKLEREASRTEKRQIIEMQQAQHEQEVAQLAHKEQVRQLDEEQKQQALGQRMLNEVEMDQIKNKNAEQAAFLKQMQEMQIDLTRYLVAQYQNPDRLIRIDGGDASQLHLHD